MVLHRPPRPVVTVPVRGIRLHLQHAVAIEDYRMSYCPREGYKVASSSGGSWIMLDVSYCPREGYKVASPCSSGERTLSGRGYCPREGYKATSSEPAENGQRSLPLLSP